MLLGSKFTTAVEVALLYRADAGEAVAMSSVSVDSDTQISALTPSGLPFGSGYSVRVRLASGEEVLLGDVSHPSWRFNSPHVYAGSASRLSGSQAGFTTRVLRHPDSLGFTDVTDALAGSLVPLAFTIIDDDTIDLTIPDLASIGVVAAPGEPFDVFLQIGNPTTAGVRSRSPTTLSPRSQPCPLAGL